jgi:hypothetical protein
MSVEHSNPNVRYIKVEKAKEQEAFRRIPKYSHIPLAVINPSPRKKRTPPRAQSPSLLLSASQARIQIKKGEQKQIPEHLMRAPMDSFTSSPSHGVSKGGRAKSAAGGPKNARDARRAKEALKKMEGESKRIKRAEHNKKVLFLEVKKHLDKAEELSQAPGGSAEVPVIQGHPNTSLIDCKTAIKDRRLLRFLYACISGNRLV